MNNEKTIDIDEIEPDEETGLLVEEHLRIFDLESNEDLLNERV